MKRLTYVALALAVMFLPLGAAAQQKADKGTEPKPTRSEHKFLEKALRDNKAEIELGRLAEQHAQSDAVKDFGKKMVSDHTKALDEGTKLAEQKGVMVPQDLDRGQKRQIDKLSKLSGADFDRAFAKDMARDHDRDVKAFEREASREKDADVKAWADKTLPTLQDHQKMAHQLASQMAAEKGGRTSGSASPSTTSGSTSGSSAPAKKY